MDFMMQRVDVVVLNWNGWSDTIACLQSLQHQDYYNFNLLVVDNDSTDGSVERIKQAMPSLEILQTGVNLGFGGGCNAGIRNALARGADYIWLINSDATVDPGALTALVRKATQNPTLGAVGSVVYESAQHDKIQLWGGGAINLWLGRSKHCLLPGTLDFISGASVLLRREAIEEVGLFDEMTFFMYWEDADLCFRLRQAGWNLAVAEDSRVWHKQSTSLGMHSPLLDEHFTRSEVRFLKRYAPIPFISISLMLGMRLIKRLAMGDFLRASAVLRGFFSS
jgi:GT2 family glycosyltransferase